MRWRGTVISASPALNTTASMRNVEKMGICWMRERMADSFSGVINGVLPKLTLPYGSTSLSRGQAALPESLLKRMERVFAHGGDRALLPQRKSHCAHVGVATGQRPDLRVQGA